MEKVYVRFGETHRNDQFISVFEGLLDGNVVKLILPTSLYTTCQAIARVIDLPAFVVRGDYVGKGKDGEPIIKNCVVISRLLFNKETENFYTEVAIPPPRPKLVNTNLPHWYKK